jgi:hypothetical protein
LYRCYNPRMRIRFRPVYLVVVPLLCLLAVVFYNLPFVHERLAWRLDMLRTRIIYIIDPPARDVFVPQEQVDQVAQVVQATLTAITPVPTAPPTITVTPTVTKPGPTDTPDPTATPTLTSTAIPTSVRLTGIVHEYQKWNNCGPANLAMALSYWGWKGNQLDTAAFLKPNSRDKNVMPYEMQNYVEEMTGLKALVRVGGDIDMVKQLVAAGFPVLVEKGFEGEGFEDWMGHYEVISGYDDPKGQFIVYDSYVGPEHDFPIAYTDVESNWRAFNNIYLVAYSAEPESEVQAILGPQADETYNLQYAAQKASDEIYALQGRDQFFAWYNRGSNLVKLLDYAGAADAYDQAFALYADIPEGQRPWRMLWYQTGPYFAYYYSGRYYDVITLATQTLDPMLTPGGEPAIEETWYWRGMAKLALGDTTGATEDFRESLVWHPGFEPSLIQLEQLGVEP